MRVVFVFAVAIVLAKDFTAGAPNGVNRSPHMVGGEEAEPNGFPYMAALKVRTAAQPGYTLCGGAILSKEWILTAANCVYLSSSEEAIVGAHNIMSKNEKYAQYLNVTKKVIHPKFNDQTSENDLALLYVPGIKMITNLIEPIQLPKLSQKGDLFTSWKIIVTGWDANQHSAKLWIVMSKIWNIGDCKQALMRTRVDQRNICASDAQGNRGLCEGDTGNPAVVLDEKGKRVLVGIATLMDSQYTCEKPFPMVFTKVPAFLDWIKETTKLNLRP